MDYLIPCRICIRSKHTVLATWKHTGSSGDVTYYCTRHCQQRYTGDLSGKWELLTDNAKRIHST